MRLRKQDGFSLTELIVTMVIFVLVIAAASNMFVGILGQFKQQSKITESNIEGLIGLQMLKSDVEQAGFGLPWNLNGAVYTEAIADGNTSWDDTSFNDSTANPPRPIVSGYGVLLGTLNSSDVLVVKATSIGPARAAQRWTYITNTAAGNSPAVRWTPDTLNENIEDGDSVVVIKAVDILPSKLQTLPNVPYRVLVSSGAIYTTFTAAAAYANPPTLTAGFQPTTNSSETHLLYGVGTGALSMPFNRADYYVRKPVAGMPSQCSTDAGTGILYKATVNQAGGGHTELPLLDCVREMKVVFGLDPDPTDDDPSVGPPWAPLSLALTAQDTRDRLKEVRIYILAHEGQRDASYTSPAVITATDPNVGTVISFDAAAANLRNYRWKVYTIVAKLHFKLDLKLER